MKKNMVISMTLGILSIFTLNYIPSLEVVSDCQNLNFVNEMLCEFSESGTYYNVSYFIIALAISWIIYKIRCLNLNNRKDSITISAILTIVTIIGKAYTQSSTLYVYISSLYNFIMLLITFIFYFFLFNNIFKWIFNKLENKKNSNKISNNKLVEFIFYKHPFVICSLIVFIVSIIYLIVCYPGNVPYDGFWQLDMYYGILEFTDHHPALVTILMGKLMDLGTFLINNNFGIFLYIFVQVIINSLVYGYVLHVMNKMNINLTIRVLSLFFFISPFLVVHSITYIKDVMFYLIFLFMFTYQYYHLFYLKNSTLINYIILLIMMFILFVFRNTGFYVAIIDLLFLFIIKLRKHSKELKYVLVMIICLLGERYIYNNVILPSIGVEKGMLAEMISIPLQQTARYINYYPDDITDEEEQVLTNIWNASLEEIATLYNADLSDDVKGIVRLTIGTEDLKEYFEVWCSMFKKHPFVYIEATLNNYYGYFYTDTLKFTAEDLILWGISSVERINTGNLDIHLNDATASFRNIIYYFYYLTLRLPLVSMLYCCATYTISLMSIGIYLFFKHKYELLIYLVPLFTIVLICCASPVNGYIRYLMPLVVSTPMLFAIFSKNIGGE